MQRSFIAMLTKTARTSLPGESDPGPTFIQALLLFGATWWWLSSDLSNHTEDAYLPPHLGWTSSYSRNVLVSWYPLHWNDPRRWSYKTTGCIWDLFSFLKQGLLLSCWPRLFFSVSPKRWPLCFTSIWEWGLDRARANSTQKWHCIWISILREYAIPGFYC